jgi:hypothetical protein
MNHKLRSAEKQSPDSRIDLSGGSFYRPLIGVSKLASTEYTSTSNREAGAALLWPRGIEIPGSVSGTRSTAMKSGG